MVATERPQTEDRDESLRRLRERLRAKGELTTAEAALYLGLNRRTLYNLLSMEQGPERLKHGASAQARNAFAIVELDRWDEARTRKIVQCRRGA